MDRKLEKNEKKKVNKKLKIASIIVWLLFLCTSINLLYSINNTKMIPYKYFVIATIAIGIISLIFGIVIIVKKYGFKLLIVLNIIMIIFLGIEIYANIKIVNLTNFLNSNLGTKYTTNVYYVIVNADSNYSSLEDISGKHIYYYKEQEKDNELINSINENIKNVKINEEKDIISIFINIVEKKEYIAVVNSGNYDEMIVNNESFNSKVRIIGTFEISSEIEIENNEIGITEEPFVVFINGIDTRSGKLPARSLSDVNIIMAINPKTRQILMIHIPRDYYVAVHGKNGAKDKLTHTGTIGGVDLTIKTIEDLFEIEIPYYARFNFNAVVKLVDAIGGIDVYSDVDYSFNSYNLPSLVINPGINHLNGEEALAFAKERHAYSSGDRHRGENQEQVIQSVIEKITSSTALLTKFDDILSSLNGSFETNFTLNEISSFVKEELNSHTKWSIEKCNVTGIGSNEYTYSYSNQKLYVMYPDKTSIDTAINKLDEILQDKD